MEQSQWQEGNNNNSRPSRSHTSLPKLATRWTPDFNTTKQAQHQASPLQQQQQAEKPTPTKEQPTRRISVSTPNNTSHKHHPHLPRRHHRHHTRDTIQSAIQLQNPFSFENPLRRSHHNHHSTSSKHNKASSLSPTRKKSTDSPRHSTSEDPQTQEASGPQLKFPESEDAVRPLVRIINASDVVQERKRRELRAAEVGDALGALSEDAHTATRKLDDTYYALLERLSALKSTLGALQELSAQASGARREWGGDARAAEEEVRGKIEGLEGLHGQEDVVDGLVGRLKRGRERKGELELRLEGCRRRLEEFQRKESEERRRVSQRWWTFWGVLAGVALLVLLIVLWRNRRGEVGVLHAMREKGEEFVGEMGLGERLGLNKTRVGVRLVDGEQERRRMLEEEKWDRVLDEL